MTTQSLLLVQKQTANFALSKALQATLYISLCALKLWTIYFASHPAVHNKVHSLRHHTLMVSCH
ncbi:MULTISPECIES: CbtB-domain containing protein [Kamptonema]|uniref:CbtB-domain containing protein n=1 Tax=Kamptonema TaxID=1501433 RepID=UPI0002D3C6EE|nr:MULTISPECIES: CbtB-domain containing protein [Kamptonema]